jgi:hypothetical protein
MPALSRVTPARKQLVTYLEEDLHKRFQSCKAKEGLYKHARLFSKWISAWCDEIEAKQAA